MVVRFSASSTPRYCKLKLKSGQPSKDISSLAIEKAALSASRDPVDESSSCAGTHQNSIFPASGKRSPNTLSNLIREVSVFRATPFPSCADANSTSPSTLPLSSPFSISSRLSSPFSKIGTPVMSSSGSPRELSYAPMSGSELPGSGRGFPVSDTPSNVPAPIHELLTERR